MKKGFIIFMVDSTRQMGRKNTNGHRIEKVRQLSYIFVVVSPEFQPSDGRRLPMFFYGAENFLQRARYI